ncbi:ATP-binding protein [Spirillospora sp. NPDC127200]
MPDDPIMTPASVEDVLRRPLEGPAAGQWFVDAALIAVWEAVANAIEHGGTWCPSVQAELSADGGQLIVTVTDHGPGFDPHDRPDPMRPEHRLRAGGRGVFLMERFMDRVDYRFPPEGGTVVTLSKNLPPDDGPG